MRFILLLPIILISSCESIKIDLSEYDRPSMHYDYADYPEDGYKTLYYNFHCTATPEGREVSKKWLDDFFRYDRNWNRPGYNLIIHIDGSVDTMQPFNLDGYTEFKEITNGVRGINHLSINFAYIGGVDKDLNPKDTRTLEQKFTIAKIVHEIKLKDRGAKIHGHRDNAGVIKACPSFDFEREYGKNCE